MFSSSSSTNSSTFGQSGTPNGAEMSACTAGAEALGAPAGASLFGGPSIGLFGAPASPLSSSSGSGGSISFGQTPASSASSTPRFDFFRTPTFGRSAPSFGQSTTPAFSQSTTPAFGQSTMSVFGESTLLAFGQSTTPAFGQSTFGQSTVPIFGQSTVPAFGQSTGPVFGQSTAPAFSQSTAPAFGQSTTAAFGDSTTPVFQQTTTPAFRQSTTSASFEARKEKATMTQFGQATKPPFGQPTTPVFWQPIAPTFSQSTMATPYPFGRHSSFFGGQVKPPTFEIIGSGQSTFGGKLGGSKGSRVTYYSGTTEVDYWGQTQPMGKLVSISAMLVYNDKSHEELRWEDYQLGDTEAQKGGSKFPLYAETLEENSGGRLLAMSAMTAYQDKSHEELRLEDYQSRNKGGSNPFAPGTPGSFGFPRSGPHETGYSWPPAGSSSPGISIWTTSSHKPSVTGPSLVPKSTEAVGPSSYVTPLFSKPQVSTTGPRATPSVPSFFDAQKSHSTGVPVPRENPGVVTGPIKEQNLRDSLERLSLVKHTTIHVYENGKVYVEVYVPAPASAPGPASVPGPAPASAVDTSSSQDKDGETNRGTKAADVMELMPKLKQADGYYTQPRIEELAVRESFEPGFCSRVKDFVFGRHGYGSVKFLGETDVRNLDLKSTIQFNDHEVVVYMDESKKTPIGQGLNKPAEITLSNVKCISKGTGKQYIDGPKVDQYKEMLMKAAAEHGAEFVFYDPVQGDWIFRVQHF